MEKIDGIGVVIIGRNEGERLKKCIKSLSFYDIPVVYVDSNSSDGSVEYAKSIGINVVSLDPKSKINASVARNAGFNWLMQQENKIEYIHFIDADCEMNKDWLKNAVNALSNDNLLAAVNGRLREKNINLSIFTRILDMSWYSFPGELNYCGGIATVRSKVYDELNGFDESLIAGADPEFYTRVKNAGYKMRNIGTDMGTHDSAMTSWKQYYTRTVKTGFGFAHSTKLSIWKHRKKSILLWALIIPAFIIISISTYPILVILLLIYPIQMLRISLKLNIPYSFPNKLLYGIFCVLDKFPQLIGVIKFHYRQYSQSQNKIIEYK